MDRKSQVLCLWFFVLLNPSVVPAEECKPYYTTEWCIAECSKRERERERESSAASAECCACAECTGITDHWNLCGIDDVNYGCNTRDVVSFCLSILCFSWAVQCLSFIFCRVRLLYAVESDKGAIATATVTRVEYQEATGGNDPSPANWWIDYEFDAVRPDGSHSRIEVHNRDMKDRFPGQGELYFKGSGSGIWFEGQEFVVKYLPETPELSVWDTRVFAQDTCFFIIGTAICGVCPLIIALMIFTTFGCLRKPAQGTGILILVMLAGSLCTLVVNFAAGMFGILRCCFPCARYWGVLGTEIEDKSGRVRGIEIEDESDEYVESDESRESSEMFSA